MNKKEVLELKRRLKKDQATFSRLVGCYVDCNHEKVCKFGGKFLTLEEDEYYKYLEISNKVLSGTLGNNLLNLQFPLEEEEVGGRQQILMALRDSELNDETLLDTYYDLVIDTYDEAGNYLILLYLDSYDVMTRTKDNITWMSPRRCTNTCSAPSALSHFQSRALAIWKRSSVSEPA